MATPTPRPLADIPLSLTECIGSIRDNPNMLDAAINDLVAYVETLSQRDRATFNDELYRLVCIENPAAQSLSLLLQTELPPAKRRRIADQAPTAEQAATADDFFGSYVPTRGTHPENLDGMQATMSEFSEWLKRADKIPPPKSTEITIESFRRIGLITNRLVPGVGNCGYEVLADSLTHLIQTQVPLLARLNDLLGSIQPGAQLTHRQVRIVAQSFFNRATTEQQLELIRFVSSPTNPEAFAESICRDGNWISHVEIYMIARALQVAIVIIRVQENDQSITVLANPMIVASPNLQITPQNTILVTLSQEVHYPCAVIGLDHNNPALAELVGMLRTKGIPIPEVIAASAAPAPPQQSPAQEQSAGGTDQTTADHGRLVSLPEIAPPVAGNIAPAPEPAAAPAPIQPPQVPTVPATLDDIPALDLAIIPHTLARELTPIDRIKQRLDTGISDAEIAALSEQALKLDPTVLEELLRQVGEDTRPAVQLFCVLISTAPHPSNAPIPLPVGGLLLPDLAASPAPGGPPGGHGGGAAAAAAALLPAGDDSALQPLNGTLLVGNHGAADPSSHTAH
jgi:hypothetical protein